MVHSKNTASMVCGQPAFRDVKWCSDCSLTTLRVIAGLDISPDTLVLLDNFTTSNAFVKPLIIALEIQDAIDIGHGHLLNLLRTKVYDVVKYADIASLYDVNNFGIRHWPADISRPETPMTTTQVSNWLQARNLSPDISSWSSLRAQTPQRRGTHHLSSSPPVELPAHSLPSRFRHDQTPSSSHRTIKIAPTPTVINSANADTYSPSFRGMQLSPAFLRSSAATPSSHSSISLSSQPTPSIDLTSSPTSHFSRVEVRQPSSPAFCTAPHTSARATTNPPLRFAGPTLSNISLHHQEYSAPARIQDEGQPQPINNAQDTVPNTPASFLAEYTAASKRYFAQPTDANRTERDRLADLLHKEGMRRKEG